MFPLPLLVETQPSLTLKIVLVVLHLAALAALLLALLPAPVHLAGIALLGLSFRLSWQQLVNSVRLRGKTDGMLEIWRDAAWHPVRVQSGSVAQAWLIVLRWREGTRCHSLALPADALPGEDHRRLRMWLRWKAGTAATPLQ